MLTCAACWLQESVIAVIKAGKMTKDLAIAVAGTTKVSPDQYLETIPFMNAIKEDFDPKWRQIQSKL